MATARINDIAWMFFQENYPGNNMTQASERREAWRMPIILLKSNFMATRQWDSSEN